MDTIMECRDQIKALQAEKAALISDLKFNRARRQIIDGEISELRIKVKDIRGQASG